MVSWKIHGFLGKIHGFFEEIHGFLEEIHGFLGKIHGLSKTIAFWSIPWVFFDECIGLHMRRVK